MRGDPALGYAAWGRGAFGRAASSPGAHRQKKEQEREPGKQASASKARTKSGTGAIP
ncbi:MAG: hypothetical protein ACJ78V_21840 [Myxococcales bacterium]